MCYSMVSGMELSDSILWAKPTKGCGISLLYCSGEEWPHSGPYSISTEFGANIYDKFSRTAPGWSIYSWSDVRWPHKYKISYVCVAPEIFCHKVWLSHFRGPSNREEMLGTSSVRLDTCQPF